MYHPENNKYGWENFMKCPNCGSNNCQFISNTITHNSGFGFGDACCGYICLGPIGLLCGLCNMDQETKIKEYWVCQECGTKFSAKDMQKAIEQKKEKTTFVFFKENPDYEINAGQSQLWELFEKYYNEKICGGILEKVVLTKNPSMEDPGLEKLKSDVTTVYGETANILFAVTIGDGICISEDSIVWKGHGVFFNRVQQISCYQNIIYINQSGINFPSEEIADAVFELLQNMLPQKKQIRYQEYKELLHALVNMTKEDCGSELHFSTRPEYAAYVKQTFECCMDRYKQMEPEKYAEYMEIKGQKTQKETKALKVVAIFAVAGGIAGWILGHLGGALLGIFLCGIVPVIVVECLTMTDKWNAYRKQYLPEDLYKLLIEDESTNTEKQGNIDPMYYENYLTDCVTDIETKII